MRIFLNLEKSEEDDSSIRALQAVNSMLDKDLQSVPPFDPRFQKFAQFSVFLSYARGRDATVEKREMVAV